MKIHFIARSARRPYNGEITSFRILLSGIDCEFAGVFAITDELNRNAPARQQLIPRVRGVLVVIISVPSFSDSIIEIH